MSTSLRLLCLNLVSQVHLPDLLGPVVPGVPAGTLQGTVQSIVQEIPVAGTVSRIAYAAVPAVPAGAHIPIRIEQVPVMIDHAPLVRRITAVRPPVPIACLLYTSSTSERFIWFPLHVVSPILSLFASALW